MTQHLPEVEHVDTDLDPVLARRAGAEVVRRFGTGEAARELIAMLGIDGAAMRSSDSHRQWPVGPSTAPVADEEPEEPRQTWRARAACQYSDTELWFPVSKGVIPTYVASTCGACRVRVECGRWALDTGQTYGVWAGRDFEIAAERVRLERDLADVPAEGERVCSCGTTYVSDVPDRDPCSRGQVPAARSTEIVVTLTGEGWTQARIAEVSGVAKTTVAALWRGNRHHVRAGIEAGLVAAMEVALTPPVSYVELTPEVRERVTDLRRAGLTNAEIAELVGCISKDVASAIIGGRVKTVHPDVVTAVMALPTDEVMAS